MTRKPERTPRRVVLWDEDGSTVEAVAIERNGNLTWVERDDGRGGWVAPFEIAEG